MSRGANKKRTNIAKNHPKVALQGRTLRCLSPCVQGFVGIFATATDPSIYTSARITRPYCLLYTCTHYLFTRLRLSIARISSVSCTSAPWLIAPGSECCGIKFGVNSLGRWRGSFFCASFVFIHTSVSRWYMIRFKNISFQPHCASGFTAVYTRHSLGN